METWSAHHLFEHAEKTLGAPHAEGLRDYALFLRDKRLPVIFSLRHLAKITGVDYRVLHATVSRKREKIDYRLFAINKRSGGRRFIHAPCNTLAIAQDFINKEILQKISLHPAAYAFHSQGGIRRCAEVHCGAKWLFHFDLRDFFHHVSEMEVYAVFKDAGYRSLMAFEFARICTNTHLPKRLAQLCKYPNREQANQCIPYPPRLWGVLPQGASTSPMLSNLAANKLDEALTSYSRENGFVYTRYADDLIFSAIRLPEGKSRGRIRGEIVKKIYEQGFIENKKKFRVAGPGSRKVVLGLLVDGQKPRLTRETVRRIDRYLYASKKYGVDEVAKYERFESTYGFYNHLSGLIAYTKDVDTCRWKEFNRRLRNLSGIGVI